MWLGALRAKPLSVSEALALDQFIDEYVGIHGILYLGQRWTDEGFQFVLLPKQGGLDGETPPVIETTTHPNEILEIREPALATRLCAADVPRLTGPTAYYLDAILIGRIQVDREHKKILTDLLCAIFQRAADSELCLRQEISVINFEEHLPPLPWHGQTVWPEVVPQLQLFPTSNDAK